MPLKTISTGRGLMGGGTYADKVRGFGPIAYWPLWEKNGTVAQCLTNPAMNGTYSSDVSTWPVQTGIGDGNTAPYFDGTNDSVNILTVALIAAFNGTTGTVAIWVKVPAAAWTDGTSRRAVSFQPDANNYVYTRKNLNANQLRHVFLGNAVGGGVNTAHTEIVWMPLAMTWNGATMQAYANGVVDGAPLAINAWAVPLAVAAVIGAWTTVPAEPWQGNLAHCALWNRVLTLSEIQALSVVR